MATSMPPSISLDETPLFSGRFVVRSMVAVAAFAALTAVVTVGGHRLGQTIALGGHTDRETPISVSIGSDTLTLAANTIRFPSERKDGPAERVDLYLTWPQMQGYREEDSQRFNDISLSSSLLFLQISQSTMSRDMSGRMEPIYSHLIEGDAFAGPHGLTGHRLRAEAGYNGETLLTAPRSGEPDYVVRCILPEHPEAATSGDCQRDIKLGNDLSVLYRFSSAQLADWQHIDAAIRRFVESRLAATPDGPADLRQRMGKMSPEAETNHSS